MSTTTRAGVCVASSQPPLSQQARRDLRGRHGKGGVADLSHFGYSSSAADYDNDGDLDLYVLNYEENTLFRNNGDGTFTDMSAESGLADPRWSVNCALVRL